jgi:hypothetical protein
VRDAWVVATTFFKQEAAMPNTEDVTPFRLIELGDAKVETNSPSGLQELEANPEQRFDE